MQVTGAKNFNFQCKTTIKNRILNGGNFKVFRLDYELRGPNELRQAGTHIYDLLFQTTFPLTLVITIPSVFGCPIMVGLDDKVSQDVVTQVGIEWAFTFHSGTFVCDYVYDPSNNTANIKKSFWCAVCKQLWMISFFFVLVIPKQVNICEKLHPASSSASSFPAISWCPGKGCII